MRGSGLTLLSFLLLLSAGCDGGSDSDSGTSVVADFGTTVDPDQWVASDASANGGTFNNGWSAGNAFVEGGSLVLQLDDDGCPGTCSGMPYKSGEFSSIDSFGYGRVSAKLQAANGSGLVTSLFTYRQSPHDEIDVEILGKDPTRVQFNYYVDGVGGHEVEVDLGFDASVARHTYTIEWRAGSIAWYVDGVLKHQVKGRGLPSHPGNVMVNLWPATGVDEWTGPFTYPGSPIRAYYDYIRYDSQ